MSKRKPDAVDMHTQRRYERQSSAGKVALQFPNVSQITIKAAFIDFDERTNPEPQTLLFFPESKAFFEIECPFRECVMGGFDLSIEVKNCIASKSAIYNEEKTCSGWQDRERINKHSCRLKAIFKIEVEYGGEAT